MSDFNEMVERHKTNMKVEEYLLVTIDYEKGSTSTSTQLSRTGMKLAMAQVLGLLDDNREIYNGAHTFVSSNEGGKNVWVCMEKRRYLIHKATDLIIGACMAIAAIMLAT